MDFHIRAQEEMPALRGARRWGEGRRWPTRRRPQGRTWHTSPPPASSGITFSIIPWSFFKGGISVSEFITFILVLSRSPNVGHHRLPPYHPPPPPHRKSNGGAGLVFEVGTNHSLFVLLLSISWFWKDFWQIAEWLNFRTPWQAFTPPIMGAALSGDSF